MFTLARVAGLSNLRTLCPEAENIVNPLCSRTWKRALLARGLEAMSEAAEAEGHIGLGGVTRAVRDKGGSARRSSLIRCTDSTITQFMLCR